MDLIVGVLWIALVPLLVSGNTNLVDYYEDLIKTEINKSRSYQFPKDARSFIPKNAKPKNYGSYDFVVIGAGSAGAVIASRLSEVAHWKVLLLEAGKEGNNFTEIPGMLAYSLLSENNWGYNSTPQTTCCQIMGGTCPYPRGKSLGGTTTINCLGYSRGHKAGYNKWASLGNPEWSYEKVLPYFIKSEKSQVPGEPDYHGYDGYLNVERHSSNSKKLDFILSGLQELGLPLVDLNANHPNGVSYTSFNRLNGRRINTAKAFLDPARSRPNLTILTESYVEKILINRNTNTVTGVLFSRRNTRFIAKVTKEVVLSAGVIGSPRILMHSGVGPKNHLKSLNITVIKDLPVGYNLHDHPAVYSIFFVTNVTDTQYSLRESVQQYLSGHGSLTIPLNPQAIGMFQLNPNNHTEPDFQIEVIPYLTIDDFIGINSETAALVADLGIPITTLALILFHPKARGRVYLQSKNRYDYALIDSKCFDDEDIEKMYQGVQKLLKVLDTAPLKKIDAQLLPYPWCATHKILSKDYWLCTIRHTSMNVYHGGGTCRMGPDPKKGAVVDGYARVHGVNKLRVADTSIVPLPLSGQMSAPAMMIGERVADFIKLNYKTSV